MLQEYLKAIPALAISDNSAILAQQLSDLKEASEHDSFMISADLKNKDNQIASLGAKVDELKSQLDSYASQFEATNNLLAMFTNKISGRHDGDTLSALSVLYYERQREANLKHLLSNQSINLRQVKIRMNTRNDSETKHRYRYYNFY